MPDVIYTDKIEYNEGKYYLLPNTENAEKYHHDRIVEVLKAENEQLREQYTSMGVTLAARNSEIEQLRKERDEFKRRLNDSSEWFFRWIARGKAGYAGMSMEKCVDMIWHHPDNPYAENNPWDETSKKVSDENGNA